MYLAFWVPYLNHLETDFLNYLEVFSRFFSLVGNHKKPHTIYPKKKVFCQVRGVTDPLFQH